MARLPLRVAACGLQISEIQRPARTHDGIHHQSIHGDFAERQRTMPERIQLDIDAQLIEGQQGTAIGVRQGECIDLQGKAEGIEADLADGEFAGVVCPDGVLEQQRSAGAAPHKSPARA
jgi:hypothetical protein